VAATVLRVAGVGTDEAVAALLPLVGGTIENVRERGLEAALTGPILRGDRETVARHLAVLDRLPPEVGALYRNLGRRTVALSRNIGERDQADYDAIEALLNSDGEAIRRSVSGKRSS
jgi:predicted short-subunit dehydrogenase-like oxidoreductase (DUF2520 family)